MGCLALGIFLAHFCSGFGVALLSSQAPQELLSILAFALLPILFVLAYLPFCLHCTEKLQFLMCKKTTVSCVPTVPSPWAATAGPMQDPRTPTCLGTGQVAEMAFCLYRNCRIRTGLQRELPIYSQEGKYLLVFLTQVLSYDPHSNCSYR